MESGRSRVWTLLVSAALAISVCSAVATPTAASDRRSDIDNDSSALDIGLAGPGLVDGTATLVAASSTFIADTFCLPDLTVQSLASMFDNEPGGIIGADYPRTLALENGNALWTFQDARVRTSNGDARYVHNIALFQIGTCFNILVGGSVAHPQAWMFPHHTAPEYRWFWPLDAEIGADGQVYIFSVEMHERGEHYLERAEPGAVFVARFNPDTWNIEWYGQPADTSSDLYGWSIESDEEWTYLFAQCHRQFGYDLRLGVAAHDRSCSDRVTVARVPVGRLFDTPSYWVGNRWSTDRSAATPIIERSARVSNPTQFILKNNRWLALTKIDDWFGQQIVIESAVHPGGPYVEIERRVPKRKCIVECNTYFSSWIDGQNLGGPRDVLITSLSHNRWDGAASHVYRPTYDVVLPPGDEPAPAMRCTIGHCT